MFKLHYFENGKSRYLKYDQHTSLLTDENDNELFPLRTNGEEFFPDIPYENYDDYPDFVAVSPETPGYKHNRPRRIKIQMGLSCNYSCSYCSQALQVAHATKTSSADAKIFLKQIDKWLDGSDLQKIEFWGGEPLLYWHKIEILAPALREKFPNVKFGIITNGSLLTKEKVDKLVEWGFSMAVSHDGPGQHIRGPDPFDNPEFKEIIKYAMSKMPMSFLSVLTPVSYDLVKIKEFFFNKLNEDKLKILENLQNNNRKGILVDFVEPRINFEGIVVNYNNDETSKFKLEELDQITGNLINYIENHGGYKDMTFMLKIREFIESLVNRRPSRVLYQNCQMDRPDQIAVDLLGNVMTCQNTGAEGPHRLGNVMLMDKIKLNTSWHWSKRKECSSCPLLQLCGGSCMYLEGNNFASSCHAHFAYNMAFFLIAIKVLTGIEVVGIEGDMIRPVYV